MNYHAARILSQRRYCRDRWCVLAADPEAPWDLNVRWEVGTKLRVHAVSPERAYVIDLHDRGQWVPLGCLEALP